jgi:hypothetical protein
MKNHYDRTQDACRGSASIDDHNHCKRPVAELSSYEPGLFGRNTRTEMSWMETR